MFVEEKIML